MTPDDRKELVEAVTAAFETTNQFHVDEIKSAIHEHRNGDHHRFVEELIEEKKRTRESREKIKTQVIGWGLIVALSGIGTAVYNFFIKGHQ